MTKLPSNINVLPPSDDRVFKLLLTHPDGRPVLMDTLSAVLDRRVVDVHVRNNDMPADDIDEKQERFDVNCVIDTGEQIDLEMQASAVEERRGASHKNLKYKSTYYLADLFSSQSSAGKTYDELARAYQVTFCTYTIFKKRKIYITRASMRTEDGFEVSDGMNMVFIELSKLKDILEKPVADLSPLDMWALFFQYADKAEYRDKLNEIISVKEEMGVATELLTSISQDEKERAIFRSRRMYQTDLESNLITAEKRGIEIGEKRGLAIGRKRGIEIGKEQGIEIGKERGIEIGEVIGQEQGDKNARILIAKKLKALGLSEQSIIEATGLTIEEI